KGKRLHLAEAAVFPARFTPSSEMQALIGTTNPNEKESKSSRGSWANLGVPLREERENCLPDDLDVCQPAPPPEVSHVSFQFCGNELIPIELVTVSPDGCEKALFVSKVDGNRIGHPR